MERRNAVVNELVGCPAVRGSAECGRPLLLHVTIARRRQGFCVAIGVGRLFSVNLVAPSYVIGGPSDELRRVPGRHGPDRAGLISPRRSRVGLPQARLLVPILRGWGLHETNRTHPPFSRQSRVGSDFAKALQARGVFLGAGSHSDAFHKSAMIALA